MIDFYECGIETTEVFKFDKKASKLVKYVFERGKTTIIITSL
jgi:hypothetical protein